MLEQELKGGGEVGGGVIVDALDAEEAADEGFGVEGEGWRREDGSGEDVEAADAEGREGGGVAREFESEIDGREGGRVGVDGGGFGRHRRRRPWRRR